MTHAIATTPPATLDYAVTLADKLAANERRPAFVVMDGAHAMLACPDDIGLYWNASQIVYRADPPGPNPEDDSPGDRDDPGEWQHTPLDVEYASFGF